MAAINKALESVLKNSSKLKNEVFFSSLKAGAKNLDDLGEAEIKNLSNNFTDWIKHSNGEKVDDIARSYVNDVYRTERKALWKQGLLDKEALKEQRIKDPSYQRKMDRKENSRIARQQYNQDIGAGFDPNEAVKNARLNKADLIEKRSMQQDFSPNQVKQINDDFEFARLIDPNVDKKNIIKDYRDTQSKTKATREKQFADGIQRSKEYQNEFGEVDPNSLKSWSNSKKSDDAIREASAASAQFESKKGVGETSATNEAPKKKNSMQDAMTKKQKFIMEREGYKYDLDDLKKSYTDQDKLREHISSLTGDSVDNLQSEAQMKASLNAGLHKRASNANLMDNLSYHKVPQMAAGIGTTAWLVSRLDSSKGQMSNTQLYGQQQY